MKNNHIIGVYDDPDVLVHAVRTVKEKGIDIKHVFSPFPIHEVWDILGEKTRLPWATFVYGIIGVSVTFAFLYWTSVVSYPLKFGGKPLNSLSFIIIMFVATIFVSVLLTFITFFIRQKIGPGKRVTMLDGRSTDDKFTIVIERIPEMTPEEVEKINDTLKEAGASEVNEVETPEDYVEEEKD